jgi:hypothetical protein
MTTPRPRLLIAAAVCLASLCAGPAARASLIKVGGTFTVSATNFTTDYSQTAVVGVPTLVSGGSVLLNEIINPDGMGGEWDEFIFTTVGGGPLAGNVNSFWNVNLLGVPTTQPALWDAASTYWTVNGTAVSPISPFAGGGFSVVHPNPIDPARGPVFGAGANDRGLLEGPATSFDATPFAFLSPYSFVSAGGVDPNTANGLHLIMHFDPAVSPAPEPSSLVLLATGSLGLLGLLRRRRVGAAA